MRTEAAVGPSGFEGFVCLFECWKLSLSSWSYQHQKNDVACEATTDLVLSIVNTSMVNKKAILKNKRHVKSHRNAALLHIFRKPVFEAGHIEIKNIGVSGCIGWSHKGKGNVIPVSPRPGLNRQRSWMGMGQTAVECCRMGCHIFYTFYH